MDPDHRVRVAAFAEISQLTRRFNDHVPWRAISDDDPRDRPDHTCWSTDSGSSESDAEITRRGIIPDSGRPVASTLRPTSVHLPSPAILTR